MRRNLGLALVTLSLLLASLATPAAAGYIIDTGAGGQSSTGWTLKDNRQWLAAEFTLDQGTAITEVQGWIYVWQSGYLDIKIYNDGGEIPGTDLHHQTTMRLGQSDFASWAGPQNLTWYLPAGTYWLALEAVKDGSLHAALPFNAPYPLANEAWWQFPSMTNWTEKDNLNMGLRITGTGSSGPPNPPGPVVPIPGALWLLGTGLAALGALTRRRSS